MSIANLLTQNNFNLNCNTLVSSELTTIDLASTNVLCDNMTVTEAVAFTGDIEFKNNTNPWINLTGTNGQVFGLDGNNNMKLITIGSGGSGVQGVTTETPSYLSISENNNIVNINFEGTIPESQQITTNTPSDLQISTNNNVTTIDFIANIPAQSTVSTNTSSYLSVTDNNNNYVVDFIGVIPAQATVSTNTSSYLSVTDSNNNYVVDFIGTIPPQTTINTNTPSFLTVSESNNNYTIDYIGGSSGGITEITTNTPADLAITQNANTVNINFVGSAGGSTVQGTTNEIDVSGTNPQVISLSNPIVLGNGALTIDKTEPSITLLEQPTQDNRSELFPDSLTIQTLNNQNVSEYTTVQAIGVTVNDITNNNQSSLTSTLLTVNNANIQSLNVSSNNNPFTNITGTENQVLGLGANNTLQFYTIGGGGTGLQGLTTGTSDYLEISENNNIANINFIGNTGITNINNTDTNLTIAINSTLATIDLSSTIKLKQDNLSNELSANGIIFANTDPNNILTTLINENGIQLSTNTEQASVFIQPNAITVDDNGQGHGVYITPASITTPNIIANEIEVKNLYIMPLVAPAPNQVIISQGGSNQLIWANKSIDGITSITSTDLTTSISDSVATVNLNIQSGLSAGKYDNCNVTVNNKGIITEITAGTSGGITTIDSTDLQVITSGQTSTINLLLQEGLTAGNYTNCNLTVNDKGIIEHIQSGSNGGITSISSSNTNISTNVSGNNATLELNNNLNINNLTLGTNPQTNTLNNTSMNINDVSTFDNCVVASNQIQITNPQGTTTITPTNIQVSDQSGATTTNISSNLIATNQVDTKSFSMLDSSATVLYTLPTGAPSAGQVLVGVGGPQLIWETLQTGGIQTLSSNNNNININNLGSTATVTLNDTLTSMNSIVFTPDSIQTCEIKKDGVKVNNSTDNRSIVMDGTGFSVNDANNILNSVLTNSSLTISNANDSTSLTTTSFRNKEINTPQLNMIDPAYGSIQYTLPNFGLAGKVLAMPASGTTLEWIDQGMYAGGTNINIDTSAGTLATINLNDIVQLTDNGNINIGTGTQTSVITKSNIVLTDSSNPVMPAGPAGPTAPQTANQCNISTNLIQITNQMGTSTLNPSSLSINDNTSNSTNITPTSINTNMINAKNLSIMNSINMPLYTLPTTSGTNGQVLAVQNGTQLGWVNVNSIPSTITTTGNFYFGGSLSGTVYPAQVVINKSGNNCTLSIDCSNLTNLLNDTGANVSVFQCELSGVNSSYIPKNSSISLCGLQVNQILPSGLIQTIVECDVLVSTGGVVADNIIIKFLTRFAYSIGWFFFNNGQTFDLSRQYYNSGMNDWHYRGPIVLTYQTN